MKLNIYFNGDSYVAGDELDDPTTQGFASKLANKLDATFINQAEGGSSNGLILRKVQEYLYECKKSNKFPDLIVIGWSESNREDWFVDDRYRSVAGTGPLLESYNPIDYKYWTRYMNQSWPYTHQMCKFYNRAIYNLHRELMHLRVPHLFFNAIAPLNVAELHDPYRRQEDPVLKFSWDDCYFYPYDEMSWRQWAIENKYKEITPGMYHYNEDCHDAWTEIIYNYIKEKNIK